MALLIALPSRNSCSEEAARRGEFEIGTDGNSFRLNTAWNCAQAVLLDDTKMIEPERLQLGRDLRIEQRAIIQSFWQVCPHLRMALG
jgi:hypothetical protein